MRISGSRVLSPEDGDAVVAPVPPTMPNTAWLWLGISSSPAARRGRNSQRSARPLDRKCWLPAVSIATLPALPATLPQTRHRSSSGCGPRECIWDGANRPAPEAMPSPPPAPRPPPPPPPPGDPGCTRRKVGCAWAAPGRPPLMIACYRNTQLQWSRPLLKGASVASWSNSKTEMSDASSFTSARHRSFEWAVRISVRPAASQLATPSVEEPSKST